MPKKALPGFSYCIHHTEKTSMLLGALLGGLASLLVAETYYVLVPTKEFIKLQQLESQNVELTKIVQRSSEMLRPDEFRFWVGVSVPGPEDPKITKALTSEVLLTGRLDDTYIAITLEPYLEPEHKNGRRVAAPSMMYRFLSKRTDFIGFPGPIFRSDLENKTLHLSLDEI